MKLHTANPTHRRPLLAVVLSGLMLVFSGLLQAQTPATGSIEGRVLNASTGNYLNNARVVVVGTTIEAYSNEDGEFRLRNVPVGDLSVRASFSGLQSQATSVKVMAGASARQDFELYIVRPDGPEGEVVRLEAFTVAEREMSGVAIAQHEQRYAPNIKTVVSLDEFGDMGEGNIGEFLKYVPGLDIVYSPTNPQSATIRGMPASGTLVLFDGAAAASASAGDDRRFDLATAASGNVDRLEVTKTPTPDMPANAVGGSINVISKSGFSRAKPLFKYEVFGTMTSLGGTDDFSRRLRDRAGTKNFGTGSAIQPAMSLSYILPLTARFAFNFALTYSDRNDDREFLTPTWNHNTLVQTQNQMNNLVGGGGMQMASAGMDWKLGANDLVRVNLSRSYRPGFTRQYVFRTTAGANATGDANHFQGAPTGVGTAVQAPSFYNYSRDLNRVAVSYRHDGSMWKIDANSSYSTGAYVRNDINEGFFGGLSATLGNLVVRNEGLSGVGERRVPVVTAVNRQGEPVDVFNGSVLSVTSASSNQQFVETEAFNAAVNGAREFSWVVPVKVKTGFHIDRQTRDRTGGSKSWSFNPPGGTAGRLAANFDVVDTVNSNRWYFTDVTGAKVQPQWLSPAKLFSIYEDNPTWFTLNEATAHTNEVNASTKLTETITAAYVRADAKFLENRLWLVGGVRFEHTLDEGYGPLNDLYAIYTKNADGTLARNAAGQLIPITNNAFERAKLQYTKHGAYSKRSYEGYYPSINSSFNLTSDIVARAAYARTIGRPNFNLVIPSTRVSAPDSDEPTITVVGGNLAPWTADSYDLTLEAYNVKGAVMSLSLFRKDIKNFHAADITPATAGLLQEFGLPEDYIDYDIITHRNAGAASLSGIEVGYRQSLSFLPWGKGVQIFGNVTSVGLSGSNAEDFTEFSPRNINWGLSYARPKFLAKFNVAQTKWVRRQQVLASATRLPGSYQYRAPQTRIGASLEYRFYKWMTVYCSVRNLTGEPVKNMIYAPSLPEYARPSNFQYVPAEYTFGVKGQF